MKISQTITILLLTLTASLAMAQQDKTIDCSMLKNIKLKYVEGTDENDYVEIKNNKHVEHLSNGKYYIKSDLEWVNDCEYNATMTEVTRPNFPFKPGAVMNVKFEKIEDGIVTGTGSVNGATFPVKFEIMK